MERKKQDKMETLIRVADLRRQIECLEGKQERINYALESGLDTSPLSLVNGEEEDVSMGSMEIMGTGSGNNRSKKLNTGNQEDETMEEEDSVKEDASTSTNQASNNHQNTSQAVNGVTREAFANQDYCLQNLCRYDVMMTVEEYPKKPTQALMLAGMNVFAVLKELDNTVELHSYLEMNIAKYNPIYKVDNFPTSDESEFKAYFLRCVAKDKGGAHYASILLGHDINYKDMMAAGGYRLCDIGAGLYTCNCQAELLKMAHYLLYSLREWEILNFQCHLMKAIMEHLLAKKCLVAPPGIMCCWRVVPTGERGPLAEEDRVRAIGIDVEVSEYNVVKEIIAQLYKLGSMTSGST